MSVKTIMASILFVLLCGMGPIEARTFKVASYNVQNLFDLTWDGTEYPGYVLNAGYGWTERMANIKYTHIARVIKDLGADVVALQEVETRRALVRLRNRLKEFGVNYPYFEIAGAKPTAIKCAVLSMFPIFQKKEIGVDDDRARNILKITLDVDGHPIILFVNHWKSKQGPESMRIVSARALRKEVDKLKADVDFILIGDFNSNYNEYQTFRTERKLNDTAGITGINHILRTIKDAKMVNETILTKQLKHTYLYNLWLEIARNRRWSINFFGKKESPDSIIVSRALYDEKGTSYKDNSFNRFYPDYLFKKRAVYRWQRSKNGKGRHLGKGYSDHLPIFAYFSTESFRFKNHHANSGNIDLNQVKEGNFTQIKIDPNTASKEALMAISGIGPVLSARIIAKRPYESVDDLLKVKGIGPKKLKKLRPYLRVMIKK